MLTLAWYQLSKPAAPGRPELWSGHILISFNSIHFAVISLVLEIEIFFLSINHDEHATVNRNFKFADFNFNGFGTNLQMWPGEVGGFSTRFSLWTSETCTSPTSEIRFLFLCVEFSLHTPWTQHATFMDLMTQWLTALAWFLSPPRRPKLWVLSSFIDVITLDIWSLRTLEQPVFTGLPTDNAALWWKISHPHLHFHIFMAR